MFCDVQSPLMIHPCDQCALIKPAAYSREDIFTIRKNDVSTSGIVLDPDLRYKIAIALTCICMFACLAMHLPLLADAKDTPPNVLTN